MRFFNFTILLIAGLLLNIQNTSAQLIASTDTKNEVVTSEPNSSPPTPEMIKIQEKQLSKEIRTLLSENMVYSEIAVENNFEETIRVIVLIGESGDAPKIKVLSKIPQLVDEEILEELLLSELMMKIPANYAGKRYFITDIKFSLR